MIKWIDEIEKQIDEIQAEIDGIEAGEVDAKNLSEVLDKDAPVTLTTDLQNNKVKVGLNIDSDTLEIEDGKLKVKAGGSSAKKYYHRVHLHIAYHAANNIVPDYYGIDIYKTIVNNSATPFDRDSFYQYIVDNYLAMINNYDIASRDLPIKAGNGWCIPQKMYYQEGGIIIMFNQFAYTIDNGNIVVTTSAPTCKLTTSQLTSAWDIDDIVTEL